MSTGSLNAAITNDTVGDSPVSANNSNDDIASEAGESVCEFTSFATEFNDDPVRQMQQSHRYIQQVLTHLEE